MVSVVREEVPKKGNGPRRRRTGASERSGTAGHDRLAQSPAQDARSSRGLRSPASLTARDNLRSSAQSAYVPPPAPPNQAGRAAVGAHPGVPGQALAGSSSSTKPRVLFGSTGMPGPMVVVSVAFLR